ncbi:LLM class flavin-dependent oxidoreductase [Mesorhizobium sp. WSM2561]|uniref:LLM class flavin-dependent oxidoreductase n=1 Tax=Mesorhizobium sp. WSM2561 TaxID=1040985 RepID=UPI000A012E16|nr:LLM class flavin-dependent oxidoreductase [Mesorhizobium sp. WSM2561]
MLRNDEMKLGLYLVRGVGYHEGAWRDPNAPANNGVDVDKYAHLAALAEDAAFHFVFFADTQGIIGDHATIARASGSDGFEPITLLSALSSRTRDIGLVATATTTYYQPYQLACMLASLDHLSGGRAAWNIVTSAYSRSKTDSGIVTLFEQGSEKWHRKSHRLLEY